MLITSDFAAPLPSGVGVVADAWDGTFINIGGLLSGERVDVLADVGTALEFITPSTYININQFILIESSLTYTIN